MENDLVLISLIEILILDLSVSLHEIDSALKEEAVRSNSSIRSRGGYILIPAESLFER